MERARPMKEKMDREVVVFPLELEFQSLAVFMMEVLFPICTLFWRVNNYVCCQEET